MGDRPRPGTLRHSRIMDLHVEIDPRSGFCGGVIRAIGQAEEYLARHPGETLYSLGSIVHNEAELARLEAKGLRPVASLDGTEGRTVLIRAHGEPPQTYRRAEELGTELIDCTCPVVLKLQERIREAYGRLKGQDGQLVIFGKVGHAEVLGLVGQVGGDALVIEDMDMLENAFREGLIRTAAPLEVFSQTTKSPSEYTAIGRVLAERAGGPVTVHDTICRQVSSRHGQLAEFARTHDAAVFVAGRESSNGKVLFNLCREANPRSYQAGTPEDLRAEWFRPGDRIGVCGATSTPKWLLEAVAEKILSF